MSDDGIGERTTLAFAQLIEQLPEFRSLASRLAQEIDDTDDADLVNAVSNFHLYSTFLGNSEPSSENIRKLMEALLHLTSAPIQRTWREAASDPVRFNRRNILFSEAYQLLSKCVAIAGQVTAIAPASKEALRAVTPPQSIGPVRFGVENERLVIVPLASNADEATEGATDAARNTALDLGEQLIQALTASNCDPRLLRSVVAIQQLLTSNENVIRLGILNSGLTDTIALLESELAASVTLDLRTYSNGIRMYVGQFEDWAKFLENAVNAELTSEDGAALAAAADRVVQACKDQPEFADPEVPKTIIALRELLNDPAKAGKRAIFAMLRTLENLCVAAFGHIAGTVEDTVKAARKAFSKTIGTSIGLGAAGLLLIALPAAVTLGPIGSRVPELKWVDQGLELAKKLTPKE